MLFTAKSSGTGPEDAILYTQVSAPLVALLTFSLMPITIASGSCASTTATAAAAATETYTYDAARSRTKTSCTRNAGEYAAWRPATAYERGWTATWPATRTST